MGSPLKMWPTAILFFFLPAVLFCGSGCTYLHSPQKAALARETAAEFAKVQESSASLSPAMLKNLATTQRRFAELRSEAAKNKELSFANRVHLLTWEEIEVNLEKAKQEEGKRFEAVKGAVEKLLKEIGEAQPQVQEAGEVLKRSEELLNEAIRDENLWGARGEFFRRTIAFICEKVAAKDEKLSVPGTTIDFEKEVLNKNVNEKYLKNGKVDTRDTPLSKVLGIKEIPADWPDLFRGFLPAFNPGQAPGINIIMLSLARDLAQAELDRAKLKVNSLSELMAALQESINTQFIQSAQSSIGKVKDNLVPQETTLSTFKRLRKHDNRNEIKECFHALACYAVVQTIDKSETLEWETRLALLANEYSIRLSAINAREREALIARGLQGLVTYFEGGLKPEVVGNFIRAAQAVALAVIAGGVW